MKVTGPSNPNWQALIQVLDNTNQAPIWRRIAKELSTPRRSHKPINLEQIEKLVNKDDIIVVPRKVLGMGILTKKIVIGALGFSEEARRKILAIGSEPMSIAELWEKYPKGTNIRIIK
ncbi:MAG: 50S ribosomal protein L18e [Candidatus Hodarchaeales archaeon]|jgi:large subunit ribosomal protein L18e